MRPLRESDVRQLIYAVTDVATQIVSPTKRYFLILDPLIGIAVNYEMLLPDARTVRRGTPFLFDNESSNFVGVRNADNSMWMRVPPRSMLVCTLFSQATAAGVWSAQLYNPAIADPHYGACVTEDFLAENASNVYYGSLGLQGAQNGAGAASIPLVLTASGGRQGFVSIQTGTTAAGYALLRADNPTFVTNSLLGGGCRAFEGSMSLSAISAVAEEYYFQFGIGNNVTGGAHTEGAIFLYDRLNINDNMQVKTIRTAGGGAGNVVVDTGTQPTYGTTGAEWQHMRGEVSSDGLRFDAFLDKAQVSPVGGMAFLPALTTNIKIISCGITKTAGATSRYIKADYFKVESYPVALR